MCKRQEAKINGMPETASLFQKVVCLKEVLIIEGTVSDSLHTARIM